MSHIHVCSVRDALYLQAVVLTALNRRNNAIGPEGLYRCDVMDAQNITKLLYLRSNRS